MIKRSYDIYTPGVIQHMYVMEVLQYYGIEKSTGVNSEGGVNSALRLERRDEHDGHFRVTVTIERVKDEKGSNGDVVGGSLE